MILENYMSLFNFKKKLHIDNRGNTMFETLVAFVVLAIILAIVYQMIAFCGEMRMKAADTDVVINEFNQNIYKKNIPADKIEVKDRHNEDGISGPQFYLRVSDKTSTANMKNVNDYVVGDAYRLRMDYLGAKSLMPSEQIRNKIEEEKIVTPKAVQFYYRAY